MLQRILLATLTCFLLTISYAQSNLNLTKSQTQTIENRACLDNNCLAVGQFDNGVTLAPLLLRSIDSGQSWSKIDVINGLRHEAGELFSITFSPSVWIVGGYYLKTDSLIFPLLITSADQGQTWSLVSTISALPSSLQSGNVAALTCTDNHCFAVGQYDNGQAIQPLLLVSHDSAQTFSAIQRIDNLPADFSGGDLMGVVCTADRCSTAGYYSGSHHSWPFLATSSDHGVSWSYQPTILNLPTIQSGLLDGIACTQTTCIAIGQYTQTDSNSASNKTEPLIILSTDQQQSWSFITHFIDFPTLHEAFLNTLHCEENTCVASGQYKGQSSYESFSLTSKDGGRSWKFTKNPYRSIPFTR